MIIYHLFLSPFPNFLSSILGLQLGWLLFTSLDTDAYLSLCDTIWQNPAASQYSWGQKHIFDNEWWYSWKYSCEEEFGGTKGGLLEEVMIPNNESEQVGKSMSWQRLGKGDRWCVWMWRVEYEQGSATALSNTHNTQRGREAAAWTDQSGSESTPVSLDLSS